MSGGIVERECFVCKKRYKTRRGLTYHKPDEIREKYIPDYKGEITPINKMELGFFLCVIHRYDFNSTKVKK